MSTPLELGPVVRRGLRGLRRRARLSLTVQGLSTLALGAVVLSLLSFGLDRTLRLSWETRAVYLALACLTLLALAWRRLWRPLRTPLPDHELAREVERVHPSLDWRLMSAVQFCDPGWRPGPEASRELAACLVSDVERLARDHPFGRATPPGPAARAGLRGGLVLAASLALLLGFPESAATWYQRNVLLSTTVAWPKDTRLLLLSVDGRKVEENETGWSITRGSDLELVAGVAPGWVVPRRVYLQAEGLGGAARTEYALDDLGRGRFRTVLEQVNDDFTFSLRGGDDRIGPFTLRVIRPPFLEELEVRLIPPAYTGLPERRQELVSSNLSLPLGTTVRLRARVSKPLVSGWLEERRAGSTQEDPPLVHRGRLSDDPHDGGRVFSLELVLERTAAFELGVHDIDDAGLQAPTRFTISARPDKSPTVRLEVLGVGSNVTPTATIRYRVTAEDDHGLTAGRLRLRISGRINKDGQPKDPEDRSWPLPPLAGAGPRTAEGTLKLRDLVVFPKMTLVLWGEAVDNDPRQPHTGSSASTQLRVVTPEQLLNELLRRLYELRLQLEKMIEEEQKLAEGLNSLDLKTLARSPATQLDVARVVLRGADVVEGVVAELASNELLNETARGRLRKQVATPLRRLHDAKLQESIKLAEAAVAVEPAERTAAMQLAGRAVHEVARELRAIVDRMGRIEEVAELVSQLKRIINRQREVWKRTRKKE